MMYLIMPTLVEKWDHSYSVDNRILLWDALQGCCWACPVNWTKKILAKFLYINKTITLRKYKKINLFKVNYLNKSCELACEIVRV